MWKLYGQSRARTILARSRGADRLAHAYLFRGPEGVGKQLFARYFGASLNCTGNNGFNPCGECSPCRKMAAAAHPDFQVIAPERGAIKIAQVRELIKTLAFAPYEAKYRVVLLEDVHTMKREAANGLLKTLEEPPENNILILTANAAGTVLQTIVSRCQVVPFYPLSTEDCVEVMMTAEPELSRESAELLAGLSEGSPGNGIVIHRRNLIPLWDELVTFLEDSGSGSDESTGRLLLLAEKIAALKDDLPGFLALIRLWIRDCLVSLHDCGRGVGNYMIRKEWNSSQYFAKLDAVDSAEKELARSCNRTLVCEVMLFQLSA